jgi:hypothetical protein
MRQQLFILLYLLGAIQTNVWAKSFELEYSWNCPQPANKYSECAQWAYRNKKNTNILIIVRANLLIVIQINNF